MKSNCLEINGSLCFWVITWSQEGTMFITENRGIAKTKRAFICDSEVLQASLSFVSKQASDCCCKNNLKQIRFSSLLTEAEKRFVNQVASWTRKWHTKRWKRYLDTLSSLQAVIIWEPSCWVCKDLATYGKNISSSVAAHLYTRLGCSLLIWRWLDAKFNAMLSLILKEKGIFHVEYLKWKCEDNQHEFKGNWKEQLVNLKTEKENEHILEPDNLCVY